MSNTPLKDAIDKGDPSTFFSAAKAAGIGTILNGGPTAGGGVRLHRETLAVASAAATPTHTVLELKYAKTIGTGAPAVKATQINGTAPAAGQAAADSAGAVIAFNAETTGTGTCDVVYLTADPPKLADGSTATALTAAKDGIY